MLACSGAQKLFNNENFPNLWCTVASKFILALSYLIVVVPFLVSPHPVTVEDLNVSANF